MDFNQIPLNIRTPGQYTEFDSTRARKGLAVKTPRVLLIGGMLAAGAAVASTIFPLYSAAEGKAAGGAKSVFAQMSAAFFAANSSAEVFGICLADNGAGTAATGTITMGGPSTAAGTLALYISGRAVPVAVASGRTAAQVAGDVVTAINAAADLPVTAAAVDEVITLTARHKGETGNGIDVRKNYYREDMLPAGVTAAVVAMSGGATDPAISAAVAAMADEPFDIIVSAYTTSANIAAMEAELASRWGPERQLDGLVLMAARGTQGALASIGSARNSPYSSILGADGALNPPWEWAAAYAGVVAHYGGIDPARPFQTLPLPGILAPVEADRFTRTERELLLNDGISTFTVDAGGSVLLERPISTYQLNPAGAPDDAWLDINTPLTLAYLRWTWRVWIVSKFPRHKLADDGTLVAPGSPTVTPKVLRTEAVAWFRTAEDRGLVENIDQFKADLLMERDSADRNRANGRLAPDLVNQFRVLATQIQFRL